MFEAILHVVYKDTLGFLRLVTDVLREVGFRSTDDDDLRRNLSHWRNTLNRLQVEIADLRASIESFVMFLEQRVRYHVSTKAPFVFELQTTLANANQSVALAYSALRADVALVDSRRGIEQAGSVAKLTELGFIFVPVSCVAALFSMQVNELKGSVPLSAFIEASLLTLVIVYFVRTVLNSDLARSKQSELTATIRRSANLPPGSPVSTEAFLWYILPFRLTWKRAIKLTAVLLFSSLLITPIATVWTRQDLETSFKAMLTVLGVFLAASVALVIVGENLVLLQNRIFGPMFVWRTRRAVESR